MMVSTRKKRSSRAIELEVLRARLIGDLAIRHSIGCEHIELILLAHSIENRTAETWCASQLNESFINALSRNVHGLIQALTKEGYIEREKYGNYRLSESSKEIVRLFSRWFNERVKSEGFSIVDCSGIDRG